MSTRTRRWLKVGAALLVLALLAPWLLGYVATKILEGAEFRQFMTTTASSALAAKVTYQPLSFREGALATGGMEALGMENGWFSRMSIRDLKVELNLRRLIFGKRTLEGVNVAQFDLQLDGPRLSGTLPPAPPGGEPMDFGRVRVGQARLGWKGGSLGGVGLQVSQEGDVWRLDGRGGQLVQAGVPTLDVRTFEMRQQGARLSVRSGEMTLGPAGTVLLDGDLRWGEALNLDLNLQLGKIPLELLPLPVKFKEELTGQLNGQVKVAGPIKQDEPIVYSGNLSLTDGRLAAQRLFNSIPLVKSLPDFVRPERLSLSRAEARFRQAGERLEVTQFVMESAGLVKLIRVNGDFVVEKGMIKGDFQVGVSPLFQRVAPEIFTGSADGYAWAPMHIEGPLDHPRNDLLEKLQAAVSVGGVDLTNPLQGLPVPSPADAVKSATDLLEGKVTPAGTLQKGLDFFLPK